MKKLLLKVLVSPESIGTILNTPGVDFVSLDADHDLSVKKPHKRVTKEMGLPALIMEHVPKDRAFFHTDLVDVIEANGYTASSTSSTLSALVKEGRLQRVGHGRYKVIA